MKDQLCSQNPTFLETPPLSEGPQRLNIQQPLIIPDPATYSNACLTWGVDNRRFLNLTNQPGRCSPSVLTAFSPLMGLLCLRMVSFTGCAGKENKVAMSWSKSLCEFLIPFLRISY